MSRKSLTSTIKTKNKEELEEEVIKKIEGEIVAKEVVIKSESLKKLTVEIGEELHTKLKTISAQKKMKIKDMIEEYIKNL